MLRLTSQVNNNQPTGCGVTCSLLSLKTEGVILLLHTGIKQRVIAVFAMLAVFISLLPTAFAEYTDSVIIKLNGPTLLPFNAAF